MLSGSENVKILETELLSLGFFEKDGIDTLQDGKFYTLEYPTDFLNFIDNKLLKNIPKEILNKTKMIVNKRAPHIAIEKEYLRNFKDTLKYDFVLYEVFNGNIKKISTFEIQGEGHFDPIFGEEKFVRTILSDVIKEETGTIMIPLSINSNRGIILRKIISNF